MPGENPRFNPFLVKIFLIIALTLALLIPLHLVESLIGERTNLRATAMERVANGMGHAQRIGALIWVIPVTRTRVIDGRLQSETLTYRVLASRAEVTGSVSSELRRSGIYQVPAFQAKLHIAGSISDESLLGDLAAEEGVTKTISHATLFLAVSDPAGIRSLPGISVNDRLLPVAAATENGTSVSIWRCRGPSACSFCPWRRARGSISRRRGRIPPSAARLGRTRRPRSAPQGSWLIGESSKSILVFRSIGSMAR